MRHHISEKRIGKKSCSFIETHSFHFNSMDLQYTDQIGKTPTALRTPDTFKCLLCLGRKCVSTITWLDSLSSSSVALSAVALINANTAADPNRLESRVTDFIVPFALRQAAMSSAWPSPTSQLAAESDSTWMLRERPVNRRDHWLGRMP